MLKERPRYRSTTVARMDPLSINRIEIKSKVGDNSFLGRKGTSNRKRKEPSKATNLG
jgi:hypothetical protein